MRALPIIVDLFVLLTVFAIVLFFAALGSSAPNPESNRLAMIETTTTVLGGAIPASDVMVLSPILVDIDGNLIAGEIAEVPLTEHGKRRFIVRNAAEGARFRLIISHIDVEAFAMRKLLMQVTRVYPGNETQQEESRIGQFGKEGIISVGVSQ